MRPIKWAIWSVGLAVLLPAAPALAHHGKDFLLTATDDLPRRGSFYAIVSVADTIDREEGRRSVEIEPSVLFSLSERFALEAAFDIEREEEGNKYEYAATGVAARYRIGYLGRSQWRLASLVEYEHPRGEEHDALEGRLIFVRNYSACLAAVNFVAERDIEEGGRTPVSLIAGVLRPFSPTDNLGLEVEAPFPFSDGVEILPGWYHTFGGAGGRANLKLGFGAFVSDDTTSGVFRAAFIQRF